MPAHCVICRHVPGLPLRHLRNEAQLISALLYGLLQLNTKLILYRLIRACRVIHHAQPATREAH